jgi:hypothetical protein
MMIEHPDSARVQKSAVRFLSIDYPEISEVVFRLLLTNDPTDEAVRIDYGCFSYAQGNFKRTVELLEPLSRSHYPSPCLLLSRSLERMGKLAESRAVASHIVEIFKKGQTRSEIIWHQRGLMQLAAIAISENDEVEARMKVMDAIRIGASAQQRRLEIPLLPASELSILNRLTATYGYPCVERIIAEAKLIAAPEEVEAAFGSLRSRVKTIQ